MMAVSCSKKEINNFKKAIKELAEKIRNGELIPCEKDGELLAPYPEGLFKGELGNWISAAIAYRTNPVGYQTGSGLGKYYLSEDARTEEPMIVFVGRRNSFKAGCGFLGYYPDPANHWEVISSEEPDRGAFD